ncbi:MAG TPA: hypothetical protein VHX65_20575 [Pirellulales bacterium]|nr:hypothetical protein [Pirellulales bacterium]
MKPVLQALVIADHVYEDKSTGKKVIAGTFNQIFFNSPLVAGTPHQAGAGTGTPVHSGRQAGSPYAYISLTDIHTSARLLLRFVYLSDNPPTAIFQTAIEVRSLDPLQTVELTAALPALPINREGVYAFEILFEDELLGSFRIVSKEFPRQGA